MLHRLPRRLAVFGVVLAAFALAAGGERWQLREAPPQSIEYVAATCAAGELYGSAPAIAASCGDAGNSTRNITGKLP